MQKLNPITNYRLLIAFVMLAAVSGLVWMLGREQQDQPHWPTEGWSLSSPEKHDMDSAELSNMMEIIEEHNINIDSVLVVRHGEIVFEQYRNGYSQETKHHLQSVTKSVTSMLIGIAMQQGLIESVDQRVLDFFPDLQVANMDERKQRLTLEHLLTMSDGMDWHELDYPYTDSRNSLGQMWHSEDAVQHVLDTSMIREPGESWAYNSGTSILLGGIIERVSGRDVLSFAQEHLFDPLGIEDLRWDKATGNHYHTDGGLYLTPRDMARLGYLMLQQGVWDGQQLLSTEWVAHSSMQHYPTFGSTGYGYQWWTLPVLGGYAATGHYEQKIYVLPEAEMVVVFTAYVADEDLHPTDTLLYRFILAACTDLPAGTLLQRFDQYGFSIDYPVEYQMVLVPIPGEDIVSENAGMLQFSSSFYPTELLHVAWGEVESDPDLEQYLEGFWEMISQQPDVELSLGEHSELVQDNHPTLLRYFQVSTQGVQLGGVASVWYCEEHGKAFLVSYLISPPAAEQDLLDGLQQRLGWLACHDPTEDN